MSRSRWYARVSRVLAWFGGALVFLAAILVTLDVLTRNLLRSNFFESFELTTYAFAIAIAVGMAQALVTKAHIRIEVAYVNFPRTVRAWFDLAAIATLAAAASALVYYAGQMVYQNWDTGVRSNTTLSIPLAIPQSLWLAGFSWFALVTWILCLRMVRALVRGDTQAVESEAGVVTLDEEIAASVERPAAPDSDAQRAQLS